MISSILGFIRWFLGLIWPAKDERDTERAAGEELGKSESAEAADREELDAIAKADAARAATGDSAADLMRDPANTGPARS